MFQRKNFKFCYLLLTALLLCSCTQKMPSLNTVPTESTEEGNTETTVTGDADAESSAEASSSAVAETSSTSDSSTEPLETDAEAPETDTAEDSAAEESVTEEPFTEDSPTEESTTAETVPETSILFYNCDDVMYVIKDANIRLAPSLDAPIYDVYTTGTAVQCIAKSDEWYIVSIGTGAYYIYASLLSLENPLASDTEDSSIAEEAATASSVSANSSSAAGGGILYHIGDGPTVCIDAGHQGHGNSDTEPNGPGSTTMKAKVTTGTAGAASGLTEAQLNLTVSLQLRDELLARGYNVLMVRESQDVDLSNAQRAQIATAGGADIFIRVHANGSDDTSVSGVLTMSPTSANPYVSALYPACHSLSTCVVNAICAQTGAVNRGVYETDTMSGINWTTMPVTIVEMGYMSNPTEDLLMASADYQAKIVTGIANGIDTYFGR